MRDPDKTGRAAQAWRTKNDPRALVTWMVRVGASPCWRAVTISREDSMHVLRVTAVYRLLAAAPNATDDWAPYGPRIYRGVMGLDDATALKLAEEVVEQVVAGELPLDTDCRSAWHMVIDAMASGCRVALTVKH